MLDLINSILLVVSIVLQWFLSPVCKPQTSIMMKSLYTVKHTQVPNSCSKSRSLTNTTVLLWLPQHTFNSNNKLVNTFPLDQRGKIYSTSESESVFFICLPNYLQFSTFIMSTKPIIKTLKIWLFGIVAPIWLLLTNSGCLGELSPNFILFIIMITKLLLDTKLNCSWWNCPSALQDLFTKHLLI